MFSNLSNSLRVLTSYNATSTIYRSTSVAPFKIQLRDIHLHQPMLKSIEEKLGLPAKPKRPTPPYFRFMADMRQDVKAKNPKLTNSELLSMLGKMWKSLDASKKDKYTKGFDDEKVRFADENEKYKKKLTDDDVRKIKEAKADIKERKIVLSQQKKCRELGKPKKPLTSFVRFLKAQTDRQPNEKYQKFLKRVSNKWESLSENEKVKFITTVQDKENYKKSMLQWEAKMRKLGHHDIVSVEAEVPEAPPKPHQRTTLAK